MVCQKCKKDFNPDEQVKIYNKKGVFLKCPNCKLKYTKISYTQDLKALPSGQLVRKSPKIKMSKKERLKARNNG